MTRLLSVLLALVLVAAEARAVNPDEILADPVLELRARDISKNLRCLVCQNQSIDDSDAPLARDLRLIVREQLVAGMSDSEIIDYVVARYGDFVLLKPPFKGATLALWLGPAVIVGAGVLAVVAFFRRRRGNVASAAAPAAPPPLSDAERARVRALLAEDDDRDDGAPRP